MWSCAFPLTFSKRRQETRSPTKLPLRETNRLHTSQSDKTPTRIVGSLPEQGIKERWTPVQVFDPSNIVLTFHRPRTGASRRRGLTNSELRMCDTATRYEGCEGVRLRLHGGPFQQCRPAPSTLNSSIDCRHRIDISL